MKLIVCVLTLSLLLTFVSASSLAERKTPNIPNSPLTGRISQMRARDRELDRHFRKYDLITLDPDAAVKHVKNRGKLVLKTSRRDFELEFTPYDLRAADYNAQEIGTDRVPRKLEKTIANTFKGSVKGEPHAQARMSVGVNGLEGAIITGTERYFIQPARTMSKSAGADEFIFYSAEDLQETDHSCGVTLAEEVAAQEEWAAANADTNVTPELHTPISPLSPMKIARIATDADAEYVNGFGGIQAAGQQILNVMNVVDGIYQVETGLTFQIGFQNFWTDLNIDPYISTEPSTLLGEFRDYWNANFTQHTRSLAHLWTGKDLNGGVIGIAFVTVVCRNPVGAYGLSQRIPLGMTADARTAILTAHEIGHNFSASHTNVITSNVPPEFTIACDNTIMESALGSRTGSSFCAFSRSQIAGHANAFSSCLTDSGSPPPSPVCAETPISAGATNGSITNSDCGSLSRGARHFADRYTFEGTIGRQIVITMDLISGTLDPYLYLIAPDGSIIDQAEFGSGLNARIPEVSTSGVFTLPQTGQYTIDATSSLPGQTGDYQLTLTYANCLLTPTASALHFPAAGGTSSLTITECGTCPNYNALRDPGTSASWILLSLGGVRPGARTFNINVSANTITSGRRSFILVSSTGGNSDIGGLRIPITQSGTGPECSVTPISVGQTLSGEITAADCESSLRNNVGFRADRYTFTASAGQQISISLNSSAQLPTLLNPFVTLIGPNGAIVLNDNDSGGGTNSRLPGGAGTLKLGASGTYTIEVGGAVANQLGKYDLSLAGNSPNWQPTVLAASQAELKNWIFEGRTSVYVKLTFPDAGFHITTWGLPSRAGNDFSVDAVIERFSGASSQAVTNTAQIYDLGVLAPGSYTFAFKNSGTTVKTLNFTVSATAPPPNPIDDAREFVRWQYKDFLRREPDGPGWDHWTGEITECSDVSKRFPGETEPQCIERKRANTSAAFFLSPEFQNTGYFVLRVYRGSLGRMPHFGGSGTAQDEFTRDAATVSTGIVVNDKLEPNVINANKQAFVNEFVTRAEFRAIYDGLSNAQYVDKLFLTTGVVPTSIERQTLIDNLTSGADTRVSVLFKIVDGTQTITDGHLIFQTGYGKAFYDNLFNTAFVQMEYFGYLLRDPDEAGNEFWLGKLNQFGNWVDAQMVLAFIKSPEYRSRFGAP